MSARPHPYELAFGLPAFEDETFPQIKEEAEARDVDVRDRERFLMLETVGELMRSLLQPDATRDAVTQFSAVVTHAFHYWLAGKKTFEIDDAQLRALLSSATTIGSWDMAPPAPAGYVQLPRNLVFGPTDLLSIFNVQPSEHGHAEALDGFFFIMPGANDPLVPPYEYLDVLIVLGLLSNRPGFSVIDISTATTAEAAGHFGDVVARESGSDFDNLLPGGENRLFGVTNRLEVLKLVSRCFWQLARTSDNSRGQL